jgi:hypothetical protein
MRRYGTVSPLFWKGETGRKIRRMGRDFQLLSLYLITCPDSNMIGLYYLSLAAISEELGWDSEGALKGLQRLEQEAGFCKYDEENGVIFVLEMARFQMMVDEDEPLHRKDKRIKGAWGELSNFRKSPLFKEFYQKYQALLRLPKEDDLEGASMPLRSQEQEQEHEHDQEQIISADPRESIILEFPTVGKGSQSFPLKASLLREFTQTFPDLDVSVEMRKARAWIISNSAKRKTARGMPRFLYHWLETAQNGGHGKNGALQNLKKRPDIRVCRGG